MKQIVEQSRRISIIVPTLNEAQGIASTLEDLKSRGAHEVIVVDGGSRDGTRAHAASRATRVLLDPGGLASQLNQGAREATGEVLLFHFADVRLPEGGLQAVLRALERPEVVGGAFRLDLDSPRPVFLIIAFLANLRNRMGFGPFGDQGIFVRKETFERLGGFSPEAALEDFHLVRRLKRVGRFVILGESIRSSVRRWEERGALRTSLAHLRASLFYLLGMGGRAKAIKEVMQRTREKNRDRW